MGKARMSKIAEDTLSVTLAEPKRHSRLGDFFIRLVKEHPLGTIGAVIVLVLLIVSIFADLIAPYGMKEIDILNRLQSPSAQHILGTDQLGRDTFSRLIYGARISVIIGLSATSLAAIISIIMGIITGYIGGKLDMLVQRFVDAWMSFPAILLLITVMSIVGTGMLQIIVVLGLLFGITGSRVVRSAAIAIKENVYVDAAKAIGSSTSRILIRHILPNIMAPIIVLYTTNIGAVILAEATLSFLGFGVPPGTASWGSMLSWEGRKYMQMVPALALWPGLALAIVVYAINMLGDAVRDLLDPRLRGGLGRYGRVKRKKAKPKE